MNSPAMNCPCAHCYSVGCVSDDHMEDANEESGADDIKDEIVQPETGQEVTEVDQAVFQCTNCPRKFHRKRGLDRHKTVQFQFN